MDRRNWLQAASARLTGVAVAGCAQKSWGMRGDGGFTDRARALEAASGGRLGIALHDTGSGQRWGWRADERFPMCSTFKLLLGAQALAAVDAGRATLGERLVFAQSDLVAHSPVTGTRTGAPGMDIGALCHATITTSDNTAANVLLQRLGGPPALTAFCRTLGDSVTRLDRNEPALNEATPGDPRDTTTPDAMARTIARTVLGDALRPASRDTLRDWLLDNQTGGAKLRAPLPAGWRVGDKTGSGNLGSTNDVGVLYPPGGAAPWVVCAYLTQTAAPPAARDAALAGVGALAVQLHAAG